MAGQFNYEKMRKYPHLLGEDIPVWDLFIYQYPDYFDTVDYDVHVGAGIAAPPDEEPDFDRQFRALTQKRIDVIGWKNELPTIVEVKFRVGLDTLGQVLGYRALYLRDNPEVSGLPILVVCHILGPDDKYVLDHFSIKYVIV